MRALRLTGPRGLGVVDTPRPDPEELAAGEVLLDVAAIGVCGSDLPYFRGTSTPLLQQFLVDGEPPAGFPAHEVAGVVRATRDSALSIGDTVVGWASRYTGLAEQTIVRGDELSTYDPGWEPHHAILIQPLACVLYAVEQLGDVRGRRVAVLGQGPIGALFDHVLCAAGAASIVGVDVLDRRLQPQLDVASDVVVASAEEWSERVVDAERPEIVVEAVGHRPEVLTAAIHAVAPGGIVYGFGVPDVAEQAVAYAELMLKGVTLRAGYTQDRVRVLRRAVGYLRRHPELGRLVTDVVPLALGQEAFERAVAPHPAQFKVVLVPD